MAGISLVEPLDDGLLGARKFLLAHRLDARCRARCRHTWLDNRGQSRLHHWGGGQQLGRLGSVFLERPGSLKSGKKA